MEHLCLEGTKIFIIGPSHVTKMAAMPIYSKSFKNILFQSHKSDGLETWHTAKWPSALQNVY